MSELPPAPTMSFDAAATTAQDLLNAVTVLALEAVARERGIDPSKMDEAARRELQMHALVKADAAIQASVMARLKPAA